METELQPGEFIGECTVRGLAGRGRTATVYLCERGGEEVAVKLFDRAVSDDPALRAHVRRGADRAAKLSHRHLLRVYDWGLCGEKVYVVTAWVAGTSLDRFIARRRTMAPISAARIVEQVARGIAACHHDGVVHGALTARSILIASTSDEPLVDDLERPLSETLGDVRRGGHVVRDLDYAAPWDLDCQEATQAGDVFALGCILHTLLTGTPPARSDTHERRVSGDVPMRLRNVIMRALAVSPGDRYASASASALARDLEHVSTTLPDTSARKKLARRGLAAGHGDRRPRAVRYLRRVATVAAGLAALLAVGMAVDQGPHSARTTSARATPEPNRSTSPPPETRTSTGPKRPAGVDGKDRTATLPPTGQVRRLVPNLPTTWEIVSRRSGRTDSLYLRVRGVGSVTITYRAGPGVAPMAQARSQQRRDRAEPGVRPLGVRRVPGVGVPVAGYVRRFMTGIQVNHYLRARGGRYTVLAAATNRRAGTLLARTASQAIARSRPLAAQPHRAPATATPPGADRRPT